MSSSHTEFRTKSLEERFDIYNRIMKVHCNRIPILLYPSSRSNLPTLSNEKMLVPLEFNIGMLLANLRKDLNFNEGDSLFLYSNCDGKRSKLLKMDELVSQLYAVDKAADGFLYLYYQDVETMG